MPKFIKIEVINPVDDTIMTILINTDTIDTIVDASKDTDVRHASKIAQKDGTQIAVMTRFTQIEAMLAN